MGKLRILSRRGDDCITWDQRKVEAGDPMAQAAVREAKRIFAEERARGATAFRVEAPLSPQRMDDFDPHAEQIILVPRVQGG